MTSAKDPDFCAICGDGLLEQTDADGRERIGEIRRAPANAARQMQGTDKQKREAQREFAIKVGLCPDCIEDHDLDTDPDGSLSDVYDQISLPRTTTVPERDHLK